VLHKQRELEDAAASFQQAIHLNPAYAEAHYNLGLVFLEEQKLDEAAASFQSAIHFRTDFADAHNQLGLVLFQKQQLDGAAASFQQAVRLRPDLAEAHNSLGALLLEQRKLHEAAACFQQAIRVAPGYVDAHNNLGVVHIKLGKADEAVACLQEALRLKPENADAHSNLGNALKSQLKLEEALASYERALGIKPDHAEAHWNQALTWLLMGNFQQGWPEYEWRWKKSNSPAGGLPQPLWDGSPLKGHAILLHAEQGLGDTLQFIRYAPLVKERGGKVIVECQPPLLRLLGSCPGIDQLVAQGSGLPEFEFHAPLLSLPHILGTTLATIPAETPYLFADDALVEHWRQELGSPQAFKIAIAWQGALGNVRDAERSVSLVEFAPLAEVAGVQLISLQKGPGSEQISQAGDRLAVMDMGAKTPADFMDTAAILRNVDLVVTVDTALAHLAGALGVQVWVVLPFYPDWRWLLDRADSPWYPTMRLFRQTERGNWQQVFDRMRTALLAICSSSGHGTGSTCRAQK
jgi:Tfp pilus assembly protein PilF